MWAQQCFCYVRTAFPAGRHDGISVLIIDMDAPGIEVRPLRQLTGSTDFAEVFFDDVVVPADRLVGALHDGWRVTTASLGHERGGLWVEWVAGLDHLFWRIVDVAKRSRLLSDPAVRRALAGAYEEVAGLRALGYKGFASFARRGTVPEHSLLKLATSELRQRLCELAVELEGPPAIDADLAGGEDEGRTMRAFLGSFAGTIGGGTSEIQRNAIAQHILGLPRG
jgi:alkylation response protein AidB-like acyl-CoA dehydrogenase